MFKTTKAKTPTEYIKLISDESRRADIKKAHALIRKAAPSLKPFIHSGMIGYGKMRYKTQSGMEGDWFSVGLANQKNYMSIYLCECSADGYLPEKYKKQLGKVSTGKSCIQFKKFDDLNLAVLKKLIKETVRLRKKT